MLNLKNLEIIELFCEYVLYIGVNIKYFIDLIYRSRSYLFKRCIRNLLLFIVEVSILIINFKYICV